MNRNAMLGWLVGVATLAPQAALALPSFAQQTGVPCETCHTAAFGPALTTYGQQFKLDGYTTGSRNEFPPVAAMLLTSFTHTQASQPGPAAPDFSANNNLAADQTSLFYAGRIAGKLGAFMQVTYDGIARHFSWDNLDVRYADAAVIGDVPLTYGVSLNNSPTVQDPWNSTPAWSFPYVASGLAPAPAVAPLLEGAFALQVLGATVYGLLDQHWYVEGGAYRTLSRRTRGALGAESGDVDTIDGAAPYWRMAAQGSAGSSYGSVGIFGLATRLLPGGDRSAGSDRYLDLGYDATLQHAAGVALYTANLTYIHEVQKRPASRALGAANATSNHLDTLRANAGLVWRRTWSLSAGPYWIRGGADALAYPDAPTGNPASRGAIAQIEYVPFGKARSPLAPWLNLRLGVQYQRYARFNGQSGSAAHDNDTLFAFAWLAI